MCQPYLSLFLLFVSSLHWHLLGNSRGNCLSLWPNCYLQSGVKSQHSDKGNMQPHSLGSTVCRPFASDLASEMKLKVKPPPPVCLTLMVSLEMIIKHSHWCWQRSLANLHLPCIHRSESAGKLRVFEIIINDNVKKKIRKHLERLTFFIK